MYTFADDFRRSIVSLTVVAAVLAAGAAVAWDKEIDTRRRQREGRRALFLDQQRSPENLSRMASTACVGGLAGTYPCKDIDLMAFLPLGAIGGGNGNDIWGWTDPMDGREYAIMGRSNGTSFIDVTDPVSPVYLGNLPPHGANSAWRDIKVYANHAYIVSEATGHGMQVFDLTQLRNVPIPPAAFTETAHYDGFGSAHNVAINEDTGYAYAVGTGTCSGGPHFVDLQNPAAPVYAGCHVETIYTHDTQCVIYAGTDAAYQGREICFNSNEDKINIIDVTDKATPTILSQTTYTGTGYTHQGWLTEDHLYWLQGDELDEQNQSHNTRTRIFDVRDLDAPVLIGTYDGPTAAIDHNLYTLDGYAYEANYRAGLRIVDLSEVASGTLSEVAYFDIYPSSDSASFNGAWSVYPYFDSGNVVVSGIEQGLFVLRPQLGPDFQLGVSTTEIRTCSPDDAVVTVDVSERNGYTGSVTLSTPDLPVGAISNFDPNPVVVPATSDLTIQTAGVAAGTHAFTVSATDGSATHDRSLSLIVTDAAPGQPTLTLPPNGAVEVSRAPTFLWSGSGLGGEYTIEVATDPGFASMAYTRTTTDTLHLMDGTLDPLTVYYWRVRAANACGPGPDSPVSTFTTLEVPRILLVDDDDNSPDVRDTYITVLGALAENYDVWDTVNTDNEPSAETLAVYEIVIWFSGDEFGGAAGPGPGGESALEAWLDTSRCLLVSSQDYYYDRGLSGLMQSRLGVSAATNDVGQQTAEGQGTVFAGLGPHTLAFPYSNYTDTLTPDATAEIAFNGSEGVVAVDKDAGVFRTAFWGFGLETLPTDTDRQAALGAFLAWCDALPEVDGDTDGTANGDDCAPGDGAVWTAPSPAQGLFVDIAAIDNLTWVAPDSAGGTAVVYDVLRSADPAGFMAADCVETGESDTLATDPSVPPSGGLYCYAVRARNACGSTLGSGSDSVPRVGATCP